MEKKGDDWAQGGKQGSGGRSIQPHDWASEETMCILDVSLGYSKNFDILIICEQERFLQYCRDQKVSEISIQEIYLNFIGIQNLTNTF